MTVLVWLVIGVLSGAVAGRAVSGHGFGVVMDVVAGGIGGLLGGYSAGIGGLSPSNLPLQALVALAGALVLLVLIKAIGFGRGKETLLY